MKAPRVTGEVLTAEHLRRIRAFAREKYAGNDFNHNREHMELTARWARYLAKKERADVGVCVAAAYLHDIARRQVRKKHGPPGARMARVFLRAIGVQDGIADKVCYAIAVHDSGCVKESLEAEVLWDADKLQSVGPYGYLRIIGHHLHYDTKDICAAHALTMRRHRFFYKRFHTRTGKKIARLLHSLMTEFCVLLEAVRIPYPDEIQKKTVQR